MLTLTDAIMPAGVAGWAPSLIQKARRNTLLNSLIPNSRQEWHIKTHCYKSLRHANACSFCSHKQTRTGGWNR